MGGKMKKFALTALALVATAIPTFASYPSLDSYRVVTIENRSVERKIVDVRIQNERYMAAGGPHMVRIVYDPIEPGQTVTIKAPMSECLVRVSVMFDDGGMDAWRGNYCMNDGTGKLWFRAPEAGASSMKMTPEQRAEQERQIQERAKREKGKDRQHVVGTAQAGTVRSHAHTTQDISTWCQGRVYNSQIATGKKSVAAAETDIQQCIKAETEYRNSDQGVAEAKAWHLFQAGNGACSVHWMIDIDAGQWKACMIEFRGELVKKDTQKIITDDIFAQYDEEVESQYKQLSWMLNRGNTEQLYTK
jgi:hypothetical protein